MFVIAANITYSNEYTNFSGEDWVPVMGQKLMNNEVSCLKESGTYALAQVPLSSWGAGSHAKNTEAMTPNSRLKLSSSPPSSLQDHPTGEEVSTCLLRSKRGRLHRAALAHSPMLSTHVITSSLHRFWQVWLSAGLPE